MAHSIDILGYQVTTQSVGVLVSEALSSPRLSIVNTINPHSYVEAKNDKAFHVALTGSDKLIPDGSGIVLAAKQLHDIELKKIAGTDLFYESMNAVNEYSGKVFFLGSTESVLNEIKIRAYKDFPNVQIETLSPPYKPEFTQSDKQSFIDAINTFSPDVIFVGLTAPKQEKLIASISPQLTGRMISGIGAVFDFYAGTVQRPHQIWLNLHLEWLVRLVGEPKRLWKRTFVSAPIFLFDLFSNKYKRQK